MAEKGDASKSLVDTCATAFKMGFGAIIGLNGGKRFG